MENTSKSESNFSFIGIIFPLLALILTAAVFAVNFVGMNWTSGSFTFTEFASFFGVSVTIGGVTTSASWFSNNNVSSTTLDLIVVAIVFLILAILTYLFQIILPFLKKSKGSLNKVLPILGIIFSIITIGSFYGAIFSAPVPAGETVSVFPSYGTYILVVGIIFALLSLFLKKK